MTAIADDAEAPGPLGLPAANAMDRAPACPLTVAKEREAVLAFEEMMPVVRHPAFHFVGKSSKEL